ncbi:hypothetical protein [Nonomuraea lactucae]|uniref:hypothetical protein n=1 Tax=Nonomuraea lactucae TaxID=2249762 RepID=UPI0030842C73
MDSYLEGDLAEGDVESWAQSASILHSNGDAMDIAVRGGRVVGVRGAPSTGSTAVGSI